MIQAWSGMEDGIKTVPEPRECLKGLVGPICTDFRDSSKINEPSDIQYLKVGQDRRSLLDVEAIFIQRVGRDNRNIPFQLAIHFIQRC